MAPKNRIRQIEIYESRTRLKEPFIISLGAHEYAENIFVIIRASNGLTGFGECCPDLAINGENTDTCRVVGSLLARHLLHQDPSDIGDCIRSMDAVIYGHSSIKSAFDMALYDMAAREQEMPLYRFLGGANTRELRTDYTVSLADPAKMAADARKIQDSGFQVIKIKLGENRQRDLERMQSIRNATAGSVPLRIDANQGWDVETAISLLNDLKEYPIEFCEEPIPRWAFMDLPRVKRESPIQIMADESCFDHHDAERLIQLDACDYLNLKLGKSGLFKALKIIALAEAADMKMQVGGFIETRLCFTASAHLSLCSRHIEFSDFDTPLMLEEDPILGGITYHDGGRVVVPDEPGLGASVDPAYLRTLKRVVIR
jgi:L-alanine-DL-glutamate epimerase-like enolase superfamily enzyme